MRAVDGRIFPGTYAGRFERAKRVRAATRWSSIQNHVERAPDGPWWFSVRSSGVAAMEFAPGTAERA